MDRLSYFNKTNLERLGIRDLRKLAFAIGVGSSTVYDKEELIEHTLDVIYGREQPQLGTQKGRPNSRRESKQEILEQVLNKLKKLQAASIYESPEQELQLVASSSSTYESGLASVRQVEGYCLLVGDVMYLACEAIGVWSTFCTIPKDLIDTHHLKNGMLISGEAKFIRENLYEMVKIISMPNVSNNPFDEQEISKPTEQFILDKTLEAINVFAPMAKGGRTIIFGSSFVLFPIRENFVEKLNEDNLVYILPCAAPEEVLYAKRKHKNVFATSFVETDEKQGQTLSIAFETAKELAETEKHVVVVIDSLTALAKSVSNESLVAAVHGKSVDGNLAEIRDLCSSAHATTKSSISLIAFAEIDSDIDRILFEQLLPMFSTKIELSEDLYLQDVGFPMNPTSSVSKHTNIQKPEYAKLAKEKRQQLAAGANMKDVLESL